MKKMFNLIKKLLSKQKHETSKYWEYLNHKNTEQLKKYGYENFRQTVSKNYFTWTDLKFTSGLDYINIQVELKDILKKHEYFTLGESVFHNIMTILLYNCVIENGGGDLIDVVSEIPAGNPPYLEVNGQLITQDNLNSILEYMSINEGFSFGKPSTVLEVGAGSGRTAYALSRISSTIKYIICDIPPALFIAQKYLRNAFPDKKVFYFRQFEEVEEVEQVFDVADIVFLMPDQLKLLPSKSIDLMLAIDCLHEMTVAEVQRYFNHADRLADYFYFKCWNQTTVPFDNIEYNFSSYPIKSGWREIFKKTCKIHSAFFEAMYEIK